MDGAWDMESINPKSPAHSPGRNCSKLFQTRRRKNTIEYIENIGHHFGIEN